MIELTPPQQVALDNQSGMPIQIVDPRTKQVYYLVRADIYERFCDVLEAEEEIDMQQVGALIERVMAEDDAQDPLLESYQREQEAS